MAFETVTGYCWPQSVDGGRHGRRCTCRRPAGGPCRVEVARVGAERTWCSRDGAVPADDHATPAGRATPRVRLAGGARARRRPRLAIGLLRGRPRRSTSTASAGAATPSSSCARRSARPTAPILLALATNTWHAYNDFGGPQPLHRRHPRVAAAADGARLPAQAAGRAAAGSPPTAPARPADGRPRRLPAASTTCRRRPARPGWPDWELPFLAVGRAARATRSTSSPTPTSRTTPSCSPTAAGSLFLSVGHDEYWSGPMRDTVEALHRRRRQRRLPLGQHLVLAGAPRGPDARGPGRDDGRLQGPLQAGPGVRHRPRRRAHQHLVRPPDRPAREPHDRRELRPRRLPPHRQAGHAAAPAATRSTGPTTGCSRAPASATATCSAPAPPPSATSATAATSPTATGCPYPTGDRRHAGRLRDPRHRAGRPLHPRHRHPPAGARTSRPRSSSSPSRLFGGSATRRTSSASPTATPCSAPTRRPAAASSSRPGSTDWAHGLAGRDPQVEQITRNILDRLGT